MVSLYKTQQFVYVLEKKCDRDDRSVIKASIFLIGEPRVANRYKYKLEVTNHLSGPRLNFEDQLKSIRRAKVSSNGLVVYLHPDITQQHSADNRLQTVPFDVILTIKSANV